MYCPQCGTQNDNSSVFCGNCGKKLVLQDASKYSENNIKENEPRIAEISAKPSKKKGLFVVVAIAAVAAIAIAVIAMSRSDILPFVNNNNSEFGIYIKGREIYGVDFTDMQNKFQISQTISEFVDEDEIKEFSEQLEEYCHIGKNGAFFYPDNMQYGDNGARIYYRNLNKPDKEPVYIDGDIVSYIVNENSDIILYLQEGGGLYHFDVKSQEKVKIGSSVEKYEMSPDGNKIVFINGDDDIYFKQGDKETRVIAQGTNGLEYVNQEVSEVYYKDGLSLYNLHKYNIESGVSELILEGINDIVKIYESGEIYYTKNNPNSYYAWDFVVDDMADIDANTTRPIDSSNYGSYKEYSQAWDNYKDKQRRDGFREDLNEMYYDDFEQLCYYDGATQTVISESFVMTNSIGEDNVSISFVEFSLDSKQALISNMPVNVSSLQFSSILHDLKYVHCVAARDNVYTYDSSVELNESGRSGYFALETNDNYIYDIYTIFISDRNISDPSIYIEGMHYASGYGRSGYTNDEKLVLVGYNPYDIKYEIYFEQKMIAECASVSKVDYNEKTGHLFYYTDWDYDDDYGTLNVYQNGESIKISDFVSDYRVSKDGKILFSYDSNQYHTGALYIFDDGNTKPVDTDVSGVLCLYENRHLGDSYNFITN